MRNPSFPKPAPEEPVSAGEAEAILAELASVFLDGNALSQVSAPGSTYEIEAEKDAASALPERESMYRVLVEQIPAVVFIAYLDGGIGEAYVSPQIETSLGFSQEEWLSDPIRWYQQIHPDDKERWSVDAARMLVTGNPVRSAYRVMARDGKVVWFQCEVRMIRRQDGRPWFIHGIGIDISELKRTEQALEERTSELRNLSSHLLRLQDQERRRIARELHDSLGQYLVALKLNLHALKGRQPEADLAWVESETILEKCINETRTISHLLHPPLLDEVGFLSAAAWYIEGFAKRSGITVTTDLPSSLPRLPEEIEVTLFRTLQESLTNIHRHSESSSAEISLALCNREVSLQVRDSGRGISPVILQRFQKSGTGAGVGLSGIHERVTDVGGVMEIRSDSQGTLVIVKIPISPTAPAQH
jgi:PAS domain S-box-containing protein